MTLLAGTVHHVMLCGPVILVEVLFGSMQIASLSNVDLSLPL